MFFADYCAAHLPTFQTGSVNHGACRKTPGIFEYASGINRVERLVVLFENPYFLDVACYLVGIALGEIYFGFENELGGDIC